MSSENNQPPSICIGGKVEGQNVLIGSHQTVHGDLSITVGPIAASEDVREQLQKQVEQLLETLKCLSGENTKTVQEIKLAAEDAVAEASKAKPEKRRLEIRGEGLKKAAEAIADIAPAVLSVSSQIAKTLLMIG